MLAAAIEAEAAEYVARYQDLREDHGRRLVVRNGHKPKREIVTGVGPVEVRQPRVNDRRVDENGERMRFTSQIIPPYLRRVKNVEDLIHLIPWLYLKGISTSDFSEFLEKLTGVKTASLSPTTVVRLKEIWKAEYADWACIVSAPQQVRCSFSKGTDRIETAKNIRLARVYRARG